MKIHSRKAGAQRQKAHSKKKDKTHPIAFSFATIFTVTLITFAFFNKTIEYSSQAENLAVYISKTKSEIRQLESEIAYLNIEKEELTSKKHIYKKIAQYKLGLRQATPQQVSRLDQSGREVQYARSRTVSNRTVALLQ